VAQPVAVPAPGSTRPRMHRMSVVLPAPLGPSNPIMRFDSPTNVHRSSGQTVPSRLLTASTSSTAIPPTTEPSGPPARRRLPFRFCRRRGPGNG
jgi:hypothetical protein